VPVKKIVHVILDNYAAHKHPKVRQWLDRHPRFTFHFTPTSCLWLNAVEGFFAKLAKRRLNRGVWRLSRTGTFEAFFDALAAMSETAHLVQMFDSTVVRAHVSAAGAKGGKAASACCSRGGIS
jgi:hypothetical protein